MWWWERITILDLIVVVIFAVTFVPVIVWVGDRYGLFWELIVADLYLLFVGLYAIYYYLRQIGGIKKLKELETKRKVASLTLFEVYLLQRFYGTIIFLGIIFSILVILILFRIGLDSG